MPQRADIHRILLLVIGGVVVVSLVLWALRCEGDVSRVRPGQSPSRDVIEQGAAEPVAEMADDPLGAVSASPEGPPPTLADVLEEVGDLSIPGNREKVVERMREIDRAKRIRLVAEAQERGLPVRIERPDGSVQELAGFENGQPVYFKTDNTNAAISTGANVLRQTPYDLDGTGQTVGVWDGGSARATHQEFATGARVVVQDGAASIDHATHVAGTVAAAGVVVSAKGMAPAAIVDSYDWNSDKAEMTSRAAAAPGEAGKINLSNHSYSYVTGWNYVNSGSPTRVWEWYGDGSTSTGYEYDFGRYNTYTRDSDALAFSAPYYLMFRSAGNERTDNPSNGQTVALAPGSSTVVSYSSSSHPGGDGSYRGGFETIGFDALGKNVMTVGSAADAVTSGARDPSKANVSSFSSWGPTDDGRIKPDIVANGEGVYSPLNGSNTSYGSYNGTSMSTPNATGTAALLIEEYGRLFPGGAMRASTLKGLILHTADDRGQPGPDYKYGWGLMDGVEAVDLIRDHAANPLKVRMTEDLVTSSRTTVNHEFVWDGASPIRATLCWTDPAGTATTTNDLRTARLRNNLDLKITVPGGSEHLPFVMPFVGIWTQASMDLPATTGKNQVDNVEQVLIQSPPVPGTYRCVISFDGTLANNEQRYSLLISGSANEAPPPPPLEVTAVSPNTALPGAVTLELTGVSFQAATQMKLRKTGQTDIVASSVQLVDGRLLCGLNLTGAAAGLWDVVVTNPDTESFTLSAAFTVIGALWSETFDGTVTGWTSQATTGSNAWTLTTAKSQSPTMSYFASGPASKTTCDLTSGSIPIPANGSNLQFKFWHDFNLESRRDAGKLEFSLNGGMWFDVAASGSGAVFASNGYNSTVLNGGKPSGRNEFAGSSAWSGSSGGFIETIVNLTDTAKYAGKSLRVRWRIATNDGTSSPGWYVDSASLVGGGDLSNLAPIITVTAASNSGESVTDPDSSVFDVVRGSGVGLSVTATDDGGEPNLSYTWTAASENGVPVSFSINGSNAARTPTATFEATGDYLVSVTVQDSKGLATISNLNVRVLQTASGVEVSPGFASVTVGGQRAFSATLLDQFGVSMVSQPSSFGWSATGGGTIGGTGVFAASTAGGPFVVRATASSLSGTASVTVNPASATVTLGNLLQTYDGTVKAVTVTTSPPGLPVTVSYTSGGNPASPVDVGSYLVEAVVTDLNYQGQGTGTLVIEPRSFTLIVEASPVEGGVVTGGGTFEEGTVAAISATANPGWRFTGWTGSGIADPGASQTSTPVDAAKTVTAVFEARTPYELWVEETQLVDVEADMRDDGDGDGLANLMEYALGTNPKGFTLPPQVKIEADEAATPADRLTMRFSRPVSRDDLSYHVWVGDNLNDWEEVTDITISPDPGGETESMVARDPAPAGSGRRFMKLEVRTVVLP